MKNLQPYSLLLFIFLIFACKKSGDSYQESESDYTTPYAENQDESDSDTYYNGTYCADVEYYNPNTGTRNTYQLDVEVENGYLVQIDWPNGGWLDETHFSSEDISSGECSFTSDRGCEYTVTLTEKGGGCYSDGRRLQNDVNDEVENTTCPRCGQEKEEYDEYCESCQSEIHQSTYDNDEAEDEF